MDDLKLANGSKAFLAINNWDGEALVIKLRSDTLVILSPKNFSDFKFKLQLLGGLSHLAKLIKFSL